MSTCRILLVEDNPDDEALTLRGLRDGSWDACTTVARDGSAALEKLDSMADLPAPVLLDLKLPKLDGTEVLQRIRDNERTRTLYVVVFTRSNEPGDIERCHAPGCNGDVIKPVVYETHIEAVQHIGRYWLALNRTPHNA